MIFVLRLQRQPEDYAEPASRTGMLILKYLGQS